MKKERHWSEPGGITCLIIMGVISLVLAGILCIYLQSNVFSVSEDIEGGYSPGSYTATADGFSGDVTVTTTVSENAIEDVQIVGDHETENIGSFAVQMMGGRIMEAQSPNVDALTGATVTSNAIMAAFRKDLKATGADMEAFPAKEDEAAGRKKYEELYTDIVIIGAGMTAAINSAQAGKDVILLEKMPYAGGNTTKATGGMNAAETHYQEEQGIDDSARVIDTNDKPIPGLFAAGEVVGGVHGGNRIGGNAVADIVVFGKIASDSAVDWCDSSK